MAFVSYENLKFYHKSLIEKINKMISDITAKGLHQCSSCGAPYKGKANCEYCGRGFFVDFSMYKVDEKNERTV